MKITPSLFAGTCFILLIAQGSKTMPEKTIRSDATWNAVNLSKPSFIMIKLLPQMMERMMNINQFKNPLFKNLNFGKDDGFNVVSNL